MLEMKRGGCTVVGVKQKLSQDAFQGEQMVNPQK